MGEAIFNRPSGTEGVFVVIPGIKMPGYFQMSLWDKGQSKFGRNWATLSAVPPGQGPQIHQYFT
jgi:hypothetical protein